MGEADLTLKEIKERLHCVEFYVPPEKVAGVPYQLERYERILGDRLIACCDRRGEVFRCDECLEGGIILRMIRALILKYSGSPE